MKKHSDKTLVGLIAESNYTAFTELYNRYWRQLLKISLNKIGNEADALDVVQEFFIDFWNRRQQLKIEKAVDSYLVSALYYRVFMHFRKKGLEAKHLENYTYFIDHLDVDSFDNSSALEQEEQYATLMELLSETIDQMPEKMKQVFNLKHKQSLSIAEIAENLGISTQTVKNQLSNAMIKLRKTAVDRLPENSATLFIIWLFS